MSDNVHQAMETVRPPRGGAHGPLPPLMLAWTVVTGLVDAYSYLELGRVFVANMTGNVVFLAFALGGAPGFLWWASLLAILMFMVGAAVGGRMRVRHADHRGRLLRGALVVQAVVVAGAFVAALLLPQPLVDVPLAVLVVLLGIAMGVQNAVARALSVPDLTTTVLTLTITGVAADSRPVGGPGSKAGRRFMSVACMFVGALVGTLLIHAGHAVIVLAVTLALLVVMLVASWSAASSTEDWVKPAKK